jgi:DtxR family transcriptional regulator, Mn-dependent transcriptional regulator
MEDYLEAISFIEEEEEVARVGEIAQTLDVKSSSVNAMIKTLVKRNLVKHEKYGYIKLTKAGQQIAKQVKARHRFLNDFLVKYLGINPETAAIDACGLEHSLSRETFAKLKKFVNFLDESKNLRNIDIKQRIEKFAKREDDNPV